MTGQKSNIELMIRGDQWGVQLDVKEFPIICPSCNNYFEKLYTYDGSRYGQVGSVDCGNCGETVHLTDSDNVVEYIKCNSKNKTLTIDFKHLFQLRNEDFELLRDQLHYDVFDLHRNERLKLGALIEEIEEETGVKATPIDSSVPLPEDVKRWIGLLKNA